MTEVYNLDEVWSISDFEEYMHKYDYTYKINHDDMMIENIDYRCRVVHIPYGIVGTNNLFNREPEHKVVLILPSTFKFFERLYADREVEDKYTAVDTVYFQRRSSIGNFSGDGLFYGNGLYGLDVTNKCNLPDYTIVLNIFNNSTISHMKYSASRLQLDGCFNKITDSDIEIACADLTESFMECKNCNLTIKAAGIKDTFKNNFKTTLTIYAYGDIECSCIGMRQCNIQIYGKNKDVDKNDGKIKYVQYSSLLNNIKNSKISLIMGSGLVASLRHSINKVSESSITINNELPFAYIGHSVCELKDVKCNMIENNTLILPLTYTVGSDIATDTSVDTVIIGKQNTSVLNEFYEIGLGKIHNILYYDKATLKITGSEVRNTTVVSKTGIESINAVSCRISTAFLSSIKNTIKKLHNVSIFSTEAYEAKEKGDLSHHAVINTSVFPSLKVIPRFFFDKTNAIAAVIGRDVEYIEDNSGIRRLHYIFISGMETKLPSDTIEQLMGYGVVTIIVIKNSIAYNELNKLEQKLYLIMHTVDTVAHGYELLSKLMSRPMNDLQRQRAKFIINNSTYIELNNEPLDDEYIDNLPRMNKFIEEAQSLLETELKQPNNKWIVELSPSSLDRSEFISSGRLSNVFVDTTDAAKFKGQYIEPIIKRINFITHACTSRETNQSVLEDKTLEVNWRSDRFMIMCAYDRNADYNRLVVITENNEIQYMGYLDKIIHEHLIVTYDEAMLGNMENALTPGDYIVVERSMGKVVKSGMLRNAPITSDAASAIQRALTFRPYLVGNVNITLKSTVSLYLDPVRFRLLCWHATDYKEDNTSVYKRTFIWAADITPALVDNISKTDKRIRSTT